MMLANKYKEHHGGGKAAAPKPQESMQGSAGWLMAVADSLNRHKPVPRGE